MAKSIILSWGVRSDQGRIRKNNQDAWGKFPKNNVNISTVPGQLFVIADGLGGHKAGQVASQLAIKTLEQKFRMKQKNRQPLDLREAVKKTNRHIYQSAATNRELTGMGTTCSALLLTEKEATAAHVGDSRIYLITKDRIQQLTQDHTHVGELERQGILTKEEARNHPERSVLTRAMGTFSDIPVDLIEHIPVKADTYFLLCTDGLANISSDELHRTILKSNPQTACDKFISLANKRGGEDNATAIVVHLRKQKASIRNKLFKRFERDKV